MEQKQSNGPSLFSGARHNWKFALKFMVFSVVFWLIQFGYQFFALTPGEMENALIRSFAFSGATFFGLALLSSALFKWKPQFAKYWTIRRSLGVMGFVFTFLHVSTATQFLFQGNPANWFLSLNPFENPVIFGVIAYPIFALLALTSTDWAVFKLKTKWKTIHRLVYLAYWGAVFHFATINPPALMNPAGYLLISITILALLGELYWFFKTIQQKRAGTLAIAIGIFIILLYLITAYLKWFSAA